MLREQGWLENMVIDIEMMKESLKNITGNLVCFRASERDGILPRQIADGSLLFVERGAIYSKGDFILLKDRKLGKDRIRIVKALKKKEENYYGKLVMSVKRFEMGM